MNIINSSKEDIEAILNLYDQATAFQKIKFPKNQWPTFERNLITKEIQEKRQWKLLVGTKISCIWAITFNDPQIWEERDVDPSIYIHRIATNPGFRGQNYVREIVKWAKDYAKTLNRSFIRMDTCGNNEKLIAYYKYCGFKFLGMSKLKNTNGLPCHYDNSEVCRFEIRLNDHQ